MRLSPLPLTLAVGLLLPAIAHCQTAAPAPAVATASKPVLAFTATRKRLEREEANRGSEVVTEEQWVYEVTVENRGFNEVRGLEIEYRVFVFDDRGRGSDHRVPLKKSAGTTTIEALPRSGKTTFQTEPQRIVKSQLNPDWVYTDGTSPRITDRLKGIWIRVKQNGQQVAEWMNPSTLNDKERWEMSPAQPGKRAP